MNNNLLNIAKEIFDSHGIDTHIERNATGIGLYNLVNDTIFYTYTVFRDSTAFFYPNFLSYTNNACTIMPNIMCRYTNISCDNLDANKISNLANTYAKSIDCIKQVRHDCITDIEELTQLYHDKSEIKPLSIDNAIIISYADIFIEQKTRHLNDKLNQLFKIYSQEIQLFS